MTPSPEHYINVVMPKVDGWCDAPKAKKIVDLIRGHKPSIYVEIGVFAGRSLFAAALTIKEHGGHAVGIDPWIGGESVKGQVQEHAEWWGKCDHEKFYHLTMQQCHRLGLSETCTILRSTSKQSLWLIQSLAPIGMLHIDGNHSEASALYDAQTYTPLVPSGGIILFDDLDWSSTRQAQEWLATVARMDERVGNCGFYTKL